MKMKITRVACDSFLFVVDFSFKVLIFSSFHQVENLEQSHWRKEH
jgi:hypothetical protein